MSKFLDKTIIKVFLGLNHTNKKLSSFFLIIIFLFNFSKSLIFNYITSYIIIMKLTTHSNFIK
ncbi:hypothetical protein CB17B2764 [Clostridium botulinum B str. Eklund 17B (NRP)]|nr:hypothetical protein CB17B2764 [Clostridium botulinum B str. Eklund 17B (NRP)]